MFITCIIKFKKPKFLGGKNMIDKQTLEGYWRETRKNMIIILVIWFVAAYVTAFFGTELNKITIGGFPLGYYFGAQGALIIFVILNFYNSRYQNNLDKKYGVAEEE